MRISDWRSDVCSSDDAGVAGDDQADRLRPSDHPARVRTAAHIYGHRGQNVLADGDNDYARAGGRVRALNHAGASAGCNPDTRQGCGEGRLADSQGQRELTSVDGTVD